jgi:hypothetical protein
MTEVVTEAHHYRDIRNYALHPTREQDTDREAWLTEAGSTVLAIAARRYLVKLAELSPQRSAAVVVALADLPGGWRGRGRQASWLRGGCRPKFRRRAVDLAKARHRRHWPLQR